MTEWENPKPELEIASFDFLSNEAAHEGEVDWHPAPAPVPVLIAATGEKTAPGHAALLGKRFRAAAGPPRKRSAEHFAAVGGRDHADLARFARAAEAG